MRTKTITLYQYSELSDKAKEKARDWYRQGSDDDQFAWEQTQNDAKDIGLEILTLDQHRANEGRFIESALECAEKIVKNHGDTCETCKTAKMFIDERDEIVSEAPRNDDNSDFKDESQLDDDLEELEKEFLQSLLEDYRIMLDKEIEYQNSDECVSESIKSNEYEFTEDGARA